MASIVSAQSAQELAAQRLQGAENRGYGRGVKDGKEQGAKEALAAYEIALTVARQEHATALTQAREHWAKHEAIEVRGAAYWRGKVIGGICGLVVGATATLMIGFASWGLNERSLTAGATVASDAQERGLIIDSLHQNIEGTSR